MRQSHSLSGLLHGTSHQAPPLPDIVGSPGFEVVNLKRRNPKGVDSRDMDWTISASLCQNSALTSVEVCQDKLLHEPR